MHPEGIPRLLDRHFGGDLDSVWRGDAIPARKRRNARVSHGLDADEHILVLYDDTLFGGGGDGFVITERRFSFKEILDAPRSIRWNDLTGTIRTDGSTLYVDGFELKFSSWTDVHREAVSDFLREVARHQGVPSRWNGPGILAAVRPHLGTDGDAYFQPSIPERKLRNARELFAIPDDEEVLVLYDDTLFGSAKVGWVFTLRRWAFRESFGDAGQLAWPDLFTAERVPEPPRVRVGPHSFEPLQATSIGPLLAAFDALEPLGEDLDPRDPDLERRIALDPDDDTLFAVYADWLLEHDHPRGPVAAAQGARQPADVDAPELGLLLPSGDELEVTWRWGFWDRVQLFGAIDADALTERPVYALARQVLRHPSARFARHLVLGSPADPLPAGVIEAMLTALSEASLPCVQTLAIHGGPGSFVSDRLDPSRWPHLRTADLSVGRVDPGVSAALRSLG